MPDYVNHDTLQRIRTAAVETGLDAPEARVFLLSRMNRQFVAQLPRLAAPGDQLHSDLLSMQNVTLQGDEVPIVTWLENASSRLGQRIEAEEFKRALEEATTSRERAQPRDRPPEGMERVVHGYDLLPYSFLTGAVGASRSIARLTVPRIEGGTPQTFPGTTQPMMYRGTGWLLTPSHLVTNHHVVNARSESEPDA